MDLNTISPGDKLILNAFFALKEQERFDEAVRVLLPLKEKYKQGPVIHFLLGAAQYELENFGQAINHLKDALKEQPTHALTSICLIHSHAGAGQWPLALEELRRFLSGKENNRDEHIALLTELVEVIENFSTSEKAIINNLAQDFLH